MAINAVSFVDKFLAGATKKTVARGSLIFGLDATASREKTWDLASHVQVRMFEEVAAIGALDLQLVYFRGTAGANAECKASSLGRRTNAAGEPDDERQMRRRPYPDQARA